MTLARAYFGTVAIFFLASLNLVLWLGVYPPASAPSLTVLLVSALLAELVVLGCAWRLLGRLGRPRPLLIAAGALVAATLLIPAFWLRLQGEKGLRKHAQRDEPAQVRVLLALGVKVDARGPHGETALMYAAASGSAESLELLLDHGAGVNIEDRLGRTALAYAWAVAHSECAHILMKHGAR